MRRTNLALIGLLLAGMPASAQDAAKGEAVFKRCRACHAIGPAAKNKAGPALTGIVGRKAGTVPGFNYSDAMKQEAGKGLKWNEATLTAYLAGPKKMIPKTRMAFSGLKSEQDIADVIAYLESLNAQ